MKISMVSVKSFSRLGNGHVTPLVQFIDMSHLTASVLLHSSPKNLLSQMHHRYVHAFCLFKRLQISNHVLALWHILYISALLVIQVLPKSCQRNKRMTTGVDICLLSNSNYHIDRLSNNVSDGTCVSIPSTDIIGKLMEKSFHRPCAHIPKKQLQKLMSAAASARTVLKEASM